MNGQEIRALRLKKRKARIKGKRKINNNRLRLTLFRGNRNFYAQIIDDVKGCTLVGVGTNDKEMKAEMSKANIDAAKSLGKIVAQRAKTKNIKDVYFDRGGYIYHGNIKAFAESARENGLNF